MIMTNIVTTTVFWYQESLTVSIIVIFIITVLTIISILPNLIHIGYCHSSLLATIFIPKLMELLMHDYIDRVHSIFHHRN